MDIDTSQLRSLQRDLAYAPERAYGQLWKVMQRAALNIKRDLQEEAAGSGYFSRIPVSISYETWETANGIEAEIGPEIGHERGHPRAQGSLAWIAYEGTATTPPTFPDPAGALDREADAFQTYLARAVVGDLL
ncbi:hypothetical protein [Blastococcus xanthinilyticus]|uniref:Uncharacterized protein n=1 Tax=Blastococcus xanthinilyticus TaxID=1564164 RepID=A0A5S5CNS5_9ACTN|nr:hypothetical protein [Blastococcus xanthinilyticus]TYP82071.1 hypothetical protein BD833_12055 [Blastococcus xanthinilyticus]